MPRDMMAAATLPAARFDPFRQLQREQADLGRMLGGLTLYPPAYFPALNAKRIPVRPS